MNAKITSLKLTVLPKKIDPKIQIFPTFFNRANFKLNNHKIAMIEKILYTTNAKSQKKFISQITKLDLIKMFGNNFIDHHFYSRFVHSIFAQYEFDKITYNNDHCIIYNEDHIATYFYEQLAPEFNEIWKIIDCFSKHLYFHCKNLDNFKYHFICAHVNKYGHKGIDHQFIYLALSTLTYPMFRCSMLIFLMNRTVLEIQYVWNYINLIMIDDVDNINYHSKIKLRLITHVITHCDMFVSFHDTETHLFVLLSKILLSLNIDEILTIDGVHHEYLVTFINEYCKDEFMEKFNEFEKVTLFLGFEIDLTIELCLVMYNLILTKECKLRLFKYHITKCNYFNEVDKFRLIEANLAHLTNDMIEIIFDFVKFDESKLKLYRLCINNGIDVDVDNLIVYNSLKSNNSQLKFVQEVKFINIQDAINLFNCIKNDQVKFVLVMCKFHTANYHCVKYWDKLIHHKPFLQTFKMYRSVFYDNYSEKLPELNHNVMVATVLLGSMYETLKLGKQYHDTKLCKGCNLNKKVVSYKCHEQILCCSCMVQAFINNPFCSDCNKFIY